jgi:hypothetical protein
MLYILNLVVGAMVSYFGPWWLAILAIFCLSAWKAKDQKEAALTGALALTTLWISYATFLNSTSNINMVDKIAEIFAGSSAFVAKIPKLGLIFGVITFLCGTLGSLAGSAGVKARNFFK